MKDSEILSGLAQSFLYAGAENLILSHWPVEDRSTAILMSSFYDFWLKDGFDPSESKTCAVRINENSRIQQHPVYWSGFSFCGGDIKRVILCTSLSHLVNRAGLNLLARADCFPNKKKIVIVLKKVKFSFFDTL